MSKVRVTIWNEYRHEVLEERIAKVYPKGIHGAIAEMLGRHMDYEIRTATLDEPEHGLTQEVLDNTDVLIWWGHMAHNEVSDEVVERVCKRVLDGMGMIFLHSGHHSKPFRKLMGTTCNVKWRETDENERLWIVEPAHPITAALTAPLRSSMRRPTASRSSFPRPTSFCSSALTRAARCSARVASGSAATARSSISSRGMSPSRPSTGRTLPGFSSTPWNGPSPSNIPS